jgi:hypothetical protein
MKYSQNHKGRAPNPKEDRVWESPCNSLPHIREDERKSLGFFCRAKYDLIDFSEELLTKPSALSVIPSCSFFELNARRSTKDNTQTH